MAKFGIDQIGKTTPRWAKYVFRIYFFLSKAFVGWAAVTSLFDKSFLLELTLFITLFSDPVIYAFSKMFGLTDSEIYIQNKEDEKTN